MGGDAFPIYYINLDRSKDRRSQMERQFAAANLTFVRISAVDGFSLSARQIDKLRPKFWTWLLHGHTLTAGEVACSASHLLVCNEINRRGQAFAVVLEDDVVLPPDFVEKVLRIEAQTKEQDKVMLHVGRIIGEVIPTKVLGNDYSLCTIRGRHTSNSAYLIRLSGVRKHLGLKAILTVADKHHFFKALLGMKHACVSPNLVQLNDVVNVSDIDSVVFRKRNRASVFWHILAKPFLGPLLALARRRFVTVVS